MATTGLGWTSTIIYLNLPEKIISDAQICESGSQKFNCTIVEMVLKLRQDCQNNPINKFQFNLQTP
jgi:hypothetical protein